jgi:hypothetical protein
MDGREAERPVTGRTARQARPARVLSPSGSDLFHAAIVCLPVVAFTLLMVLLSLDRIAPSAAVEGSSANPVGILTSNFVYDGSVNVMNIVTSSAFLLVVFLYYPRTLRTLAAYLLPLVAVAAGGFAELTAISTVYATPRICGVSCSFYGMSGVSNAVIGFTVASFLTCFGLMLLHRRGRLTPAKGSPLRASRSRNQLGLMVAFVLYLALLLVFAGVIALPTSGTPSQGSGTTGPPPPPAIFTQAPPTAFVHSASLTYGFLLCVGAVYLVGRRYEVFIPAGDRAIGKNT